MRISASSDTADTVLEDETPKEAFTMPRLVLANAFWLSLITGAVGSQPAYPQTLETTSFEEVQLLQDGTQPVTNLGNSQGEYRVSVRITSLVAVTSAHIQLRFPSGTELQYPLTLSQGLSTRGVWQGNVTIPANVQDTHRFISLVFSAFHLTKKYSRSREFSFFQMAAPADRPRIAVTYVPKYGVAEKIRGTVYNINPADVRVALLIFVPGYGVVSKPYCNGYSVESGTELTAPESSGAWSMSYATGGYDVEATVLMPYLFKKDDKPPCIWLTRTQALVDQFDSMTLDKVAVVRSPAETFTRTLPFAGYLWRVKASKNKLGPGSNYFINDNVFTDDQGLHFRFSRCQNPSSPDQRAWCASEAILSKNIGYGTYTATLSGRLGKISSDLAGGLFLWSDEVSYGNREIDAEIWAERYKDKHRHQFVLQPAGPETVYRYSVPEDLTTATFRFRWEPDKITYWTWKGNAPEPTPETLLATWLYDRSSGITDIPIPGGNQEVHFNLWLKDYRSVYSDESYFRDEEEEIVMNSFDFEPLAPGILPKGIVNAASMTGNEIVPGMIAVIKGYGLGQKEKHTFWIDPTGRVATELYGTEVTFDGKPASILEATDDQATVIVPSSVEGYPSADVVVSYYGQKSTPLTVPVASYAPGVYTVDNSGQGQALGLNQDGSQNGVKNPAKLGDTLRLFVTGAGALTPGQMDGAISSTGESLIKFPVEVKIGTKDAVIQYSGNAVGQPSGKVELKVKIPSDTETGDAVPVFVKIGDRAAQASITVALKK